MNRKRRPGRARSAGFTLIELLVAVTLLVMIMLATTYIFSSSTQAISEAMAATELQTRLARWDETIRKDLATIDHQHGFLVIGGRTLGDHTLTPQGQGAFGSRRQEERELSRTFRSDWLMFTTNNEQAGGCDNWTKCQWSRVFYSHGMVTNGGGWSQTGGGVSGDAAHQFTGAYGAPNCYSKYATDWVVQRSRFMQADGQVSGYDYASCDYPFWYGAQDYGGFRLRYGRSLKSALYRDFRWMGYFNYGWIGSTTINYGPNNADYNGMAIYEPLFYHNTPECAVDPRGRAFMISHCAQFRIQYALPADLRASATGGIVWHDPPIVPAITNVNGAYTVPNPNAGRLAFGPGDGIAGVSCGTDAGGADLHNVWPALLRVSVEIFDPDDRVDDSRSMTGIYAVP